MNFKPRYNGHYYHHLFFLQSCLLITKKMFKLFLLCFVLLDVFCLLKSKGTMASAATNNNHLFFSSLESFLTKCSSHSTPCLLNMFLIPYSVGFQQTCHHPPSPILPFLVLCILLPNGILLMHHFPSSIHLFLPLCLGFIGKCSLRC